MNLTLMKLRLCAFWRALLPWLLLRLRQPTTYIGLVVKVAAIFGLTITDSTAGQVAEIAAVLVGAMLVAWDQDKAQRIDDTDQAGA
ncbi:MAG: hypothetical protein GAK28_00615 [Luteibacter sp.]|uniref:hypothetical protein n=1 Tax=Luteibacter sp. TaxID=1886636 RepID=UPI00138160EF|nr:hypothetical protein [Luteibacter sp.]KAF1008983.1 MAG: hypothetical protein GAK28_00615 [Luteibacter sp.]